MNKEADCWTSGENSGERSKVVKSLVHKFKYLQAQNFSCGETASRISRGGVQSKYISQNSPNENLPKLILIGGGGVINLQMKMFWDILLVCILQPFTALLSDSITTSSSFVAISKYDITKFELRMFNFL